MGIVPGIFFYAADVEKGSGQEVLLRMRSGAFPEPWNGWEWEWEGP